jgi:GDPmannose 4,6-dehydratase
MPAVLAPNIMRHSEQDDFVPATVEEHSEREFVERTFSEVGKRLVWRGEGVDEIGFDAASNRALACTDPGDFRPTEVETLSRDATKACDLLIPPELVSEMVAADVAKMASLLQTYRGA